jgi:hypothetical protein
MARIIYSVPISEIVGSIGGVTFQRNASGFIAKAKSNPTVNPGKKQAIKESAFGSLVALYATLTIAEKESWAALALANLHTTPWGIMKKLNGFQQFISNNTNLSLCGVAARLTAPDYILPPAPDPFILTFEQYIMSLVFAAPYSPAPNTFFVYITPPLRTGTLKLRKSSLILPVGTWDSNTIYNVTAGYEELWTLIYYDLQASSNCTIIVKACVIDPVRGFRSVFQSDYKRMAGTVGPTCSADQISNEIDFINLG